MPRPTIMWFWALLGFAIIGYSLYTGGTGEPARTNWNAVSELVEQGEVEKIVIVNRETAEVFLTSEATKRYRSEEGIKRFGRIPETGAQMVFTIGSVDAFREDLQRAEARAADTHEGETAAVRQVVVDYENRGDGFTGILISWLPWIFLLVLWFFVMRGMSNGGAGGGGGLMNVGKARAQVFDKEKSRRITFKDVAGLEEAKVEIMEIVDFLKKKDKYVELGA